MTNLAPWKRRFIVCLSIALSAVAMLDSIRPVSAAVDPDVERAVAIAYRLEVELGSVDAAQRHLLVARVLLALKPESQDLSRSLRDRILEWNQSIEALEPGLDETEPLIPSWSLVGADSLQLALAAAVPEQAELIFSDPLWDRGRAVAALQAVTSAPNELAAVSYRSALAWAAAWAPEIWYRLLKELQVTPEWQPLLAPVLEPWLAMPLNASASAWRELNDEAGRTIAGWRSTRVDFAAALRRELALMQDEALLVDSRLQQRGVRWLYHAYLRGQFGPSERAKLAVILSAARLPAGSQMRLLLALFDLGLMLESGPPDDDLRSRFAGFVAELDAIEGVLLQSLTATDRSLADVYQQARVLLRLRLAIDADRSESPSVLEQWANLASIVRMETVGLPGYLGQPARAGFRNELHICSDLSRPRSGFPIEPIRQEQFDNCVATFVRLGTEEAATPELSGLVTGPFEAEQLLRESELSRWQRINYWRGYLARLSDGECDLSGVVVVNPLEWSLASRALVWFIRQWPHLANGATLAATERLFAEGKALQFELIAMRSCQGPERPIGGALQIYAAAAAQVGDAMRSATQAFRAERLAAEADVDLGGDSLQSTQYRPVDLTVRACEEESVCGANVTLNGSRALYGLFEAPYLIADQTRFGALQVCYRDVEWVERRASLPEGRPPAMADYFGRLAFSVEGRFSGFEDPVFVYRVVSDSEHEYLFGANTEEVLADPCPLERLNRQITAELPDRWIDLVPRRLTFMTAERTSPQKLLEANWETGEEWRDRFATGDVEALMEPTSAASLQEPLNIHLAGLNQQWNRAMFRRMLLRDSEELVPAPLFVAAQGMEVGARVATSLSGFLVANGMIDAPLLRATVLSDSGLLSRLGIARLQQQDRPASAVAPIAAERLVRARQRWRAIKAMDEQLDAFILATMLDLSAILVETVGRERLLQSPE